MTQDTIIPLWPNQIPNSLVTDEKEEHYKDEIQWIGNVQIPDMACFLPTKRSRTGASVLICPGGGYGGLAYDWEGTDIARWFNSKGITAFVLKYRLPGSKSIKIRHKAPLQDAQRGMRMIRKMAKKWGLDPNKIGVMGFSAGGHLASTLGTQYATIQDFSVDNTDTLSAKPDFMILVYPVITMESAMTHQGSKNNLLGENPSIELVKSFSNEYNVDKDTPPTFLLHSSDDEAVPVSNSLKFYQALVKHKVPAEMHIYPYGGHGYALAIGQEQLSYWPEILHKWMINLLKDE